MEESQCPPQAAFILWPKSVQSGQDLALSCVKHRGGRRHRVILGVRWMPHEGEWWLISYREMPDVVSHEPGTEPM